MGCVWSNADLVGGGYRIKIVKQIAEGGFSQILLCADIDSNESFAVKKLVKHSPESEERIAIEASILRQLSDVRNVVPLLATIQADDVTYLVFPFYRKGSVGDELLRRRPRNDCFSQATVANFLRTDDGTPLLTDFGSATKNVPFQSLGCCLYALCYFVSPFDLVYEKGNSVALAVQSPEKLQYPDMKQFDQRLIEVIRGLLVVDPNQRLTIHEAVNLMTSIEKDSKDSGDSTVIA